MLIGDRLRAIHEAKRLSQGDVENRSGLKRSYISRVENGHTVPSVETLEKLARACSKYRQTTTLAGKFPAQFREGVILR
jgi:transcriptional regulator with XRE-family HTH domain